MFRFCYESENVSEVEPEDGHILDLRAELLVMNSVVCFFQILFLRMGIKFPDAGAKRVLKLSKRSAKVRKALDKSHLRDLKSKKLTSNFNKIDHAIESRKAGNEDVEAQRLFYEEMGISADEAEDASEGEAYEKLHKGSFRNVDKSVFENNKKVAKLPVKFDDKVVPQEDVGDDFDVADLPDDYMEVDDVEVSDAEVMSGAEEDEDSEDVDDKDAQNEDIEGGSAAQRRGLFVYTFTLI